MGEDFIYYCQLIVQVEIHGCHAYLGKWLDSS